MNARIERRTAAAYAIRDTLATRNAWDMADAALTAADAVMFSDEAMERTERVLTMHAVTTDGLAEGAGWCAECGNVGDDNEYHLARAVIAALKGDV